MAAAADLRIGQTVEWYDTPIGGCATGKVEDVSRWSGWVTVRINAHYAHAPRRDGSGAPARRNITHVTLRAHELTPRD